MTVPVSEIMFAAITGDAAGYTFDGMKKNHIKAVFKEIKGFTDPSPGLKHNMNRWRKPGLYSSISQNLLLTGACVEKKGLNIDAYLKAIKSAPELPGTDFSIFRYTGEAEKNFIYKIRNSENTIQGFNLPCSRLLPPVIPLLLVKNEQERILSAVNYISLFTGNSSTITCSVLLLQLIFDLSEVKNHGILQTSLLSAEKTKNMIESIQDRIFNAGLNPDYIISEADALIKLFRELNDNSGSGKHEDIICRHASKNRGKEISRASVNLPDTILPMAVVLSDLFSDTETIIESAIREGGASSSLTSITSALSTAFYSIDLPGNFTHDLANKKRISTFINQIVEDKNRISVINEILQSESGLTIKEMDEFKARNKNLPQKNDGKMKKNRADIESELSRHVVESWTKLDKAKWKKERKRDN